MGFPFYLLLFRSDLCCYYGCYYYCILIVSILYGLLGFENKVPRASSCELYIRSN